MATREALATCQGAEADLATGLHHSQWEALAWESGALVGLTYGLLQHVARPLWVQHFQTEFPLDRFVPTSVDTINFFALLNFSLCLAGPSPG